MPQNIAGIDVHKKLLVVIIADPAKPDVVLQSRRFGTGSAELQHLSAWLCQYGVVKAVMESTAQYWKPVWMELEPHMRLHLAQAHSNKAPKGRKSDLADAKRLVRRFAAGELMLSFIPEPEQRAWLMVTRGRLQLIRERVQLQNQIESLLEEGRVKLSSVITDLLGASGRRILRAMAKGETRPETLAALGDKSLKCGFSALVDALTGSMGDIHRQLLSPASGPDRAGRRTDRGTEQTGGGSDAAVSGCGHAPDRDSGHRGGGSAGDPGGDRTGSRRLPVGPAISLLDRCLPRLQ